ncbi:putative cysteine synthase [Gordonia araii NBRC 100433]|uniref:Putative cysteine synthase n=1 Tax=Gordonia araii NBRC 100433 TaxID=1073574 RepID=G7GYU5_9ACTN|nr:PLP-dependent cysteine synthase family protein [Gordonia araii]GAB08770.1 putative cysteine synthase [Gordonia araii NBRC 100433]
MTRELQHGTHIGLANLVGNTPVTRIDEPFTTAGEGFWAKLECYNPGGGMKDRPALHMVAAARERGDLLPGARIVESTSGTLGLGLAMASMVYGHPLTVVTDPGLEPIVVQMLTAYGAEVDVVTEPCPVGGWQQARKDRVAERLAQDPTAWCPDQYSNPDNVAGYEQLGLELAHQLGEIDVLVCSVGTGGHSKGVGRTLRRFNPGLEIVGVDTIGSTIFGQPAQQPRLMRGLGSSIFPENVDYDLFSEIHWVAPNEAVWACRELAANHYVSGGWSVGAVSLVAGWVARTRGADTRVAAIFPDGMQRYFATIYDDEYCERHGLLGRPPAESPVTLDDPFSEQVARWTRCPNPQDPKATIDDLGAE